ncbi:MAG: MBOAT family protein, partial [Vicingaceae bacterium]
MGKIETKAERKPFILISVFSNLMILGIFKYFNFFSAATNDLAQLLNIDYATPYMSFILPMGISFYTFQTMSYSI